MYGYYPLYPDYAAGHKVELPALVSITTDLTNLSLTYSIVNIIQIIKTWGVLDDVSILF